MPSSVQTEESVSKPPSHASHRVYKNAAALGFGQVANTVGNLLLVPLFLSYWPKEVYGEWIALSALVAYFSTADMGMNMACANALIKAYQTRNWEQYREIQASALVFYIGMACALTALAAAACVLLPIPSWLGVSHIPSVSASVVICLLAGRILWQMPVAQIWNIFRTTGDMAISQWIVNLQTLGIIAVTATILYRGSGVTALASATCLPLLVCAPISWFLVRRSHKELLPHLRAASMLGVKMLVKPSFLFALIMIAMAISLNGPVIIVARVLGGAAVALLVTTRTLANVARQIPAMLCWALWPELTRLEAIGAKVALRTAHNLVVGAYMAISIAFVGALWLDGPDVITFWTRGHLSVQPWLMRAFLLYVLCQAPWMASSVIATATNRHRKLAWCQVVAGLAAIVFILVFMPHLGLIAVPLSLLAGEALACYHFVIADACAIAEESYQQFAVRTWSALVLVTALTLAVSAIAHHLPIVLVPLRIGISGVIAAATAAIGIWNVFLPKSDRLVLAERFSRSIFGRVR